MAHANAKKVELKRIAEILWKGSPTDEKTPFAAQGALSDNGSFSKNLEAGDNKKAAKEFPEEEGKNEEGPMSIPRKVCFALSFNVWILYFLVLGWLLPCRPHNCGPPYPEIMERSLPNIRPLTDVEPMNEKGLPSLAIFGYYENKEWKLAALATFDATFEWNVSLPFVPQKIQCNFEHFFDANEDGIKDCLLSGFEDVYAFNASNGNVFWHQRLPSLENDILSGFHPTVDRYGEVYLIGTYGDKMVVLSARSGNKTLETDLPCSYPTDIRLLTNPVGSSNVSDWSLVCFDGDTIEAWSFDERDLLRGENSENNSTGFTRFFSSNAESIDLRRDVTTVPGGPLFLSLGNRVAMVTRKKTEWERDVPYPLAGIAAGHFGKKTDGVAVALNNGTDAFVLLLRQKDGGIDYHFSLENRQALSVYKVPGDGDRDLLLVKSVVLDNSTHQTDDLFDGLPHDNINFALIEFSKQIREIANETSVLKTSVNIQTNGATDLLILKAVNGTTVYKRYLIRGSEEQNSICHSAFGL